MWCDALKQAMKQPLIVADAQMQHCLQDMMHRASAVGQEIISLEGMTMDAVSLEVGDVVLCSLQQPS